MSTGDAMNDGVWRMLTDELVERLAERLAPRLAELISVEATPSSPWLTTSQAVAYSGLPEGTFRKLAACGKILPMVVVRSFSIGLSSTGRSSISQAPRGRGAH